MPELDGHTFVEFEFMHGQHWASVKDLIEWLETCASLEGSDPQVGMTYSWSADQLRKAIQEWEDL